MNDEPHVLVQIYLAKGAAESLANRAAKQLRVTSVQPADEEEVMRFGIVEAVTIVGLVKGVLEVSKLAVELYKLLRERQATSGKAEEAVITSGSVKGPIVIRSTDDESMLLRHLANRLQVNEILI